MHITITLMALDMNNIVPGHKIGCSHDSGVLSGWIHRKITYGFNNVSSAITGLCRHILLIMVKTE